MEAINFSDFRKNMKNIMDMSYENHQEIIITRKDNKNMIVISLDDYNAMKETVYLLSSKNNANNIFKSIKQAKDGNLIKKEIK